MIITRQKRQELIDDMVQRFDEVGNHESEAAEAVDAHLKALSIEVEKPPSWDQDWEYSGDNGVYDISNHNARIATVYDHKHLSFFLHAPKLVKAVRAYNPRCSVDVTAALRDMGVEVKK